MKNPESCGVDTVTYATILKVFWYFLFIINYSDDEITEECLEFR
jgi:hypothetical protein